MKEIKNIILQNSENKIFGCIHCKEESELCINDLSIMVDEINKSIKDLQHHKDTTIGLSATDKTIQQISILISNMLNDKFNLKSIDTFDIKENITDLLNDIIFEIK